MSRQSLILHPVSLFDAVGVFSHFIVSLTQIPININSQK